MKQSLSGRLLVVLPMVLAAACVIATAAALLSSLPTANDTQTGTLSIVVRDGYTEEPLSGVTVVIPEMNQSFLTDDDGHTGTIAIPVLEDAVYQSIRAKPWGEVTLLVYAPGYLDCALFHVAVVAGQTRSGPTILLFPDTGDMNGQPFTMTEGPNAAWVNGLLDQFRPVQRK